MKTAKFYLENGVALTLENEGDSVVVRASGAEIGVHTLVQSETFASFGNQITDEGARLDLDIQRH